MIGQFFGTELGAVVYLTLLAAGADFVVGVIAAKRAGTFEWKKVGAVIGNHVLGRILPIFALLGIGFLAGLVPTPDALGSVAPAVFTLAGHGLAVVYVSETLGSILANLKAPPQLTAAEQAAGVQLLSTANTPRLG